MRFKSLLQWQRLALRLTGAESASTSCRWSILKQEHLWASPGHGHQQCCMRMEDGMA